MGRGRRDGGRAGGVSGVPARASPSASGGSRRPGSGARCSSCGDVRAPRSFRARVRCQRTRALACAARPARPRRRPGSRDRRGRAERHRLPQRCHGVDARRVAAVSPDPVAFRALEPRARGRSGSMACAASDCSDHLVLGQPRAAARPPCRLSRTHAALGHGLLPSGSRRRRHPAIVRGDAARARGVRVLERRYDDIDGLQRALGSLGSGASTDAIFIPICSEAFLHMKAVARAAAETGLPAAFTRRDRSRRGYPLGRRARR